MAHAVIASAVRTPIGAFTGAPAGVSATELGTIAVAEAVRRAAINKVWGSGLKAVTAGRSRWGTSIGASGARVLTMLLHEIARRGARLGVVMVVERPEGAPGG